MARAAQRAERPRAGVLLLSPDRPTAQAYLDALEEAAIPVECVTTTSALRFRLAGATPARPTLLVLLPSQKAVLRPRDLVTIASWLAAVDPATPDGAPDGTSALDEPLDGYCATRLLSRRQRQVLQLYLTGNNDKEIASSFNCSATTVYEHWRRMARKANGLHKSDVVNDFHRFLATRPGAVTPSLLAGRPRVRARPRP